MSNYSVYWWTEHCHSEIELKCILKPSQICNTLHEHLSYGLKLLFVIFDRLLKNFFGNFGNKSMLSYLISKNDRFLCLIWPMSDLFFLTKENFYSTYDQPQQLNKRELVAWNNCLRYRLLNYLSSFQMTHLWTLLGWIRQWDFQRN